MKKQKVLCKCECRVCTYPNVHHWSTLTSSLPVSLLDNERINFQLFLPESLHKSICTEEEMRYFLSNQIPLTVLVNCKSTFVNFSLLSSSQRLLFYHTFFMCKCALFLFALCFFRFFFCWFLTRFCFNCFFLHSYTPSLLLFLLLLLFFLLFIIKLMLV